jgi:hypothetical protein
MIGRLQPPHRLRDRRPAGFSRGADFRSDDPPISAAEPTFRATLARFQPRSQLFERRFADFSRGADFLPVGETTRWDSESLPRWEGRLFAIRGVSRGGRGDLLGFGGFPRVGKQIFCDFLALRPPWRTLAGASRRPSCLVLAVTPLAEPVRRASARCFRGDASCFPYVSDPTTFPQAPAPYPAGVSSSARARSASPAGTLSRTGRFG